MTGAAPADARCVVVGGAGAVGRLVADWFAPLGPVRPVDRHGGADVRHGDVTDPDPELLAEIAGADVVVLAVPEQVAIDAAGRLVRAMRPGSLLVDTLSVKGPYTAELRRSGAGAAGLEVLGLNPMFAPSLDPDGRPVASVTVVDGPAARRARELVVRAGARLVPVSPDEHDRLAATTQALTHAAVLAFGAALSELGADMDTVVEIAPPPHLTMLGLLARITSGAPEVYRDVQAANPHAAPARAALARAARRLADLFEADGPDGPDGGFDHLLTDARGALGTHERQLAALCARSFDRISAGR